VADYVGERTSDQCVHRWEYTVNPNIRRGKWNEEEDQVISFTLKKCRRIYI